MDGWACMGECRWWRVTFIQLVMGPLVIGPIAWPPVSGCLQLSQEQLHNRVMGPQKYIRLKTFLMALLLLLASYVSFTVKLIFSRACMKCPWSQWHKMIINWVDEVPACVRWISNFFPPFLDCIEFGLIRLDWPLVSFLLVENLPMPCTTDTRPLPGHRHLTQYLQPPHCTTESVQGLDSTTLRNYPVTLPHRPPGALQPAASRPFLAPSWCSDYRSSQYIDTPDPPSKPSWSPINTWVSERTQ